MREGERKEKDENDGGSEGDKKEGWSEGGRGDKAEEKS